MAAINKIPMIYFTNMLRYYIVVIIAYIALQKLYDISHLIIPQLYL